MTPAKFPIPSVYFGEKAAAHQRNADSVGYRSNPAARAAELNEVAIYTQLQVQALGRETRKSNG